MRRLRRGIRLEKARPLFIVLLAGMWAVGAPAAAVCYSKHELASWQTEVVTVNLPAGEYGLEIPSVEIGQTNFDAMDAYGKAHPDRRVQSTKLVVVIDGNGQATFRLFS
jgi:hypothetical protein